MTRDDVLTFLQNNKAYLSEHYFISKIGLFGSFARNEQTDSSDIDVIFELKEDASNIHDLKNNLRLYLSKSLHRSVDLAREKYLKPYASKFIKQDVIYV